MEKLKIEKKLRIFLTDVSKNGGIYIIISTPKTYNSTNLFILRYYITENKKRGIYITLNKRYDDLTKTLEENKISTSQLYFIDGVTKNIDKNKTAKNCMFISSPESLTDLSLSLATAMETGKFEFLFIDSVNTLLIYNALKTTEKFMHFIITKVRNANIKGIIFSIEDDMAKDLISTLTAFCDGALHTKDLE